MDVVMTDSRQRIAEDHLQAMLKANQAADARERLDRLIDEDNKHAAWTATALQQSREAKAAAKGMYIDDYLRATNQHPSMEGIELDYFLAAWTATARQKEIERKASDNGMWPERALTRDSNPRVAWPSRSHVRAPPRSRVPQGHHAVAAVRICVSVDDVIRVVSPRTSAHASHRLLGGSETRMGCHDVASLCVSDVGAPIPFLLVSRSFVVCVVPAHVGPLAGSVAHSMRRLMLSDT